MVRAGQSLGSLVISNEALVDFYLDKKVGTKSVHVDVSAKFEAGAAPSIGAIVQNIGKVYKTPTAEEKESHWSFAGTCWRKRQHVH